MSAGLTDFVSFITGAAAFSGLAADRFYPTTLPQTPTFPAATYLLVSDIYDTAHDGAIYPQARLQIDCYAGSYLDAHALADAVDRRLRQWHAVLGDAALIENKRDVPEPTLPPLGARFRVSFDVLIGGLEI